MKGETWRRLRLTSQAIFLGLFLLLVMTPQWIPGFIPENLFFRLNPLVGIASMLAGKTWIPALALGMVTLAGTLIFGRIWCGWICPMGTVLQIFSPSKKKNKLLEKRQNWRKIKYFLFFLIVFGALLGNQTLLVLDPITILNRSTSVAVWPAVRTGVIQTEDFLYQFRFLWGELDWLHQRVTYPLFLDIQALYSAAFPIFIFFALLISMNWIAERFWCRYLCPLGGLLGLISRHSFLQRRVSGDCTGCGLCNKECPTGTIDPERNYQSDPAECLVCMDCVSACNAKSANFRWQLADWGISEKKSYDPDRRMLLSSLGAAAAGVALAGVEPINRRKPANLILPPGAGMTDFYSLCIRCGECVRVCPTQALQSSLLQAGWQHIHTPTLVARLGYCQFNCKACMDICPSGALASMSLEDKQRHPIGLASINQNRCLPWAYQTPCIVCEEVCPLPSKAIGLEGVEMMDENGERSIIQRPYIKREICIGCGVCEYHCPMDGEAAIRVYSHVGAGVF